MKTNPAIDLDRLVQTFQKGGAPLLEQFNRQQRPHTRVPVVPSLRGAPDDRELLSLWKKVPRTLLLRLRIGSQLADLEPTVDNSYVFSINAYGRKIIISRHAGIKGWLEANCNRISYSTAMQYKILAARLRRACGISAEIPLEWLLPDCAEDLSKQSADVRSAIRKGSRKLLALLTEFPNLSRLTNEVEKRLGIVRIPKKIHIIYSIRNRGGSNRNPWRKTFRKRRTNAGPKRSEKALAAAQARRELQSQQKGLIFYESIAALHQKRRLTPEERTFREAFERCAAMVLPFGHTGLSSE